MDDDEVLAKRLERAARVARRVLGAAATEAATLAVFEQICTRALEWEDEAANAEAVRARELQQLWDAAPLVSVALH